MALPKVLHPTKKIFIPSLDREVEFEPFTTQDEKSIILMDSSASLYEKSLMQQNIIEKCCQEEIDFSNMSTVEITYLFLQLRKISVGGTLDLSAKCPECGNDISIQVDIDLIKLNTEKLKPLKFTINTDDGPYIVVCSHFRCSDLKYINVDSPSFDDASTVIRMLMRPDGNDIIELTQEEKIELFNQLDTKDAEKIVAYINDAPALEKKLEIQCGECEHKFEGELKDFFI